MATFDERSDIHAPVATVWSILTDSSQWSRWLPIGGPVSQMSGVTTGSTFQWQEGRNTGTGTISRVEPEHLLEFTTQVGGHAHTHTFLLDPHRHLLGGTDSMLEYRMSYQPAGGIVGEFIVGDNPFDEHKVRHALSTIKQLAEDQADRH